MFGHAWENLGQTLSPGATFRQLWDTSAELAGFAGHVASNLSAICPGNLILSPITCLYKAADIASHGVDEADKGQMSPRCKWGGSTKFWRVSASQGSSIAGVAQKHKKKKAASHQTSHVAPPNTELCDAESELILGRLGTSDPFFRSHAQDDLLWSLFPPSCNQGIPCGANVAMVESPRKFDTATLHTSHIYNRAPHPEDQEVSSSYAARSRELLCCPGAYMYGVHAHNAYSPSAFWADVWGS